jgi:hypothetical protein
MNKLVKITGPVTRLFCMKWKGKRILWLGDGMRKVKEISLVYLIGSTGYSMLEILWRGYTHWTMAITGGICFYSVYTICHKFARIKTWKKCLLGALSITSIEFVVGCFVNRVFRMNVWDYSKQRFHLLGQICPLYSALWFLLCIPLVPLCNTLRRKFSASEKISAPQRDAA